MKLLSAFAAIGAIGALAVGALLLSAQPAQAATITVTTQNDLFAAGPTGCSLRRAINAANNNSDFNGCVGVGVYGNDVIVFDPSIVTVTLTINVGGGDNDSNSYRDLDIGDLAGGSLSIIGPPAGVAVVASAGLGDRVFDITPNAGGNVTMTNLIIVGGLTPTTYETGASGEVCYQGGGGIRHRGGGQLTLREVRIESNTARAGGGVCYSGNGNSRLSVSRSMIQGNATQGSNGGGILSAGPTLIISTRVLSNTAVISEANARGGGGIFQGPSLGNALLEVLGGSVSFNTARRITGTAEAHGGGIATGAPTTLTQVSIVSNTLESVGPNALGGGVFSGHALVADQLSVVGNVVSASTASGGGLYTSGSPIIISDTAILSNTVGAGDGGGWWNSGSDALLFGGEVRFNTARRGGGVFNSSAQDVWIMNGVEVCNNQASILGGGVSNVGNTARLYVWYSTVCGNSAQNGGGIYNGSSASLGVGASWITGNSASSFGGGIHQSGVFLEIAGSAVTSNTAGTSGGGLWGNSSVSAINSTFSGNGNHGIVAISSVYLTYTTIASNSVAGLLLSSGANARLRATLLAGNGSNCVLSTGAVLTSNDDNLSSDATCAALTAPNDLTNTNPLLRPLGFASPFDFTPTHLPMPNSPALNRIPPARCIASDQRGVTRPQNSACDVGAVEMATWHNYAPIVRKQP